MAARLVECAAAERVPRLERLIVKQEAIDFAAGCGGVLEFEKFSMGPGDVLVWRVPDDVPNSHASRQLRHLRSLLPPEKRPSVMVVLRSGEAVDVFNVPNMSDDGIMLGARALCDRLDDVRPARSDDALKVPPEQEATAPRDWKKHLESIPERGLKPCLDWLIEWLSGHGYNLTKKPTFAELMAESNRLIHSAPRNTPERQQRVTEALEKECLWVVEGDASELVSMISDAVESLRDNVCLNERMVHIAANPATWSALGRPSSLMGHHCTMNDLTADGTIMVVASSECESADPSRIVLVKLRGCWIESWGS
jgi:hypothetical protein